MRRKLLFILLMVAICFGRVNCMEDNPHDIVPGVPSENGKDSALTRVTPSLLSEPIALSENVSLGKDKSSIPADRRKTIYPDGFQETSLTTSWLCGPTVYDTNSKTLFAASSNRIATHTGYEDIPERLKYGLVSIKQNADGDALEIKSLIPSRQHYNDAEGIKYKEVTINAEANKPSPFWGEIINNVAIMPPEKEGGATDLVVTLTYHVGRSPILAGLNDTTKYGDGDTYKAQADDNKYLTSIYLIKDVTNQDKAGKTILKIKNAADKNEIIDSHANKVGNKFSDPDVFYPTYNIPAIAVSKDNIFAAVSSYGTTWDAIDRNNYRGIAIVKREADKLKQVQCKDLGTEAVKDVAWQGAYPIYTDCLPCVDGQEQYVGGLADLRVSATVGDGVTIAFTTTGDGLGSRFQRGLGYAYPARMQRAEIGAGVNMRWDPNLERLFIGLSGVKRDNPAREGGVCNTFVGRISDPVVSGGKGTTFAIAPIIKNLNKDMLFDTATYNKIKEAETAKTVAVAALRATYTLDQMISELNNKYKGGAKDHFYKSKELKYGITRAAIEKDVYQPIRSILNYVAGSDGLDNKIFDIEKAPDAGKIRESFFFENIMTSTEAFNRILNNDIEGANRVIIKEITSKDVKIPGIPRLSMLVTSTSTAPYACAALNVANAIFANYKTGVEIKDKISNIKNAVRNVLDVYAKSVPTDVSGLNDNHLLVGYYGTGSPSYNGDKEVRISNNKSTIMHTSTGKDYMIVNAVTGLPATGAAGMLYSQSREGVFALPLLSDYKWNPNTKAYEQWDPNYNKKQDPDIGIKPNDTTLAKVFGVSEDGKTDYTFEWPTYAGTLSAVDSTSYAGTFDAPPSSYKHMPRDDKAPFIVGNKLFGKNQSLTGLEVIGDTVYMSFGGYINRDTGIFASTALFNGDGAIVGWSSPQRVYGGLDRVLGTAIEPTTGDYFCVEAPKNVGKRSTIDSAEFCSYGNTPVMTNWNQSGWKDDTQKSVSNFVNDDLTNFNPGLIFTFDETTPGFAKGKLTIAVAIDRDSTSVELIQTSTGGLAVQPAYEYREMKSLKGVPEYEINGSENAVRFDISKLGIGKVTCVELARSTRPLSGWIFLGGSNGVAVLSNEGGFRGDPKKAKGANGLSCDLNALSVMTDYDIDDFNDKYGQGYFFKQLFSSSYHKGSTFREGFSKVKSFLDLTFTCSDKKAILQELDSFYTTTIAGIEKNVAGACPNTAAIGINATFEYLKRIAGRGRGWPSAEGLSGFKCSYDAASGKSKISDVFPYSYNGPVDNIWTFKMLTPTNASTKFQNTRKMLSDGKNLYIMTINKIYAIPLDDARKFSAGSIKPDDTKTFKDKVAGSDIVNGVGEVMLFDSSIAKGLPKNAFLTDMIIVANGRSLVLATTKGLFIATKDSASTNSYTVAEVLVKGGSIGPVVEIKTLSSEKGKFGNVCNLNVLAADFANDTGKVYKLHMVVTDEGQVTTCTPVKFATVTNTDGVLTTTYQEGEIVNLSGFYRNMISDEGFFLTSTPESSVAAPAVIQSYVDGSPVTTQGTITALTGAGQMGNIIRDNTTGSILIPTTKGLYSSY